MSVEIRVPTTLGESVVEATVARWLKGEGEPVQRGDVLVELETDKVNVEVTAEQDGTLEKIVKQEGEVVGVNDVLGTIGEQQATATSPAAPVEASAPVGTEEPPRQPEEARTAPVETHQSEEATSGPDGRRSPSPLARRIAAEHNIDLSQVKADSPHGRVTRDDVMHYLEQQDQPPVAEQAVTATAAPAAAPSQPQPPTRPAAAPSPASALAPQASGQPARREERVRLSRRRQTIAQRLVETQRAAAMLTTFNEIDMSAILDVRARRKETFKERHNVSLGFMSFFTKAVIGALKAFPRLNAEIQGNEMLLKYYYDIGIAVGAEEGLVVPVVRDADRKSFAEIEREIAALARRVRDNTLTLAELQGGTFTITNGGVFGSLLSTPILNGPQVGILGMHKIEQRPVAIDGQVVIRPMMYVALSYDHRIVDGREAVQFLVRVKELLEDPETLLLEG
ncbi:MAG: 2-oxoglutarate dehydrogenase complex dihydrolipoyllysine-residue succinyltransferase [Ktedonobacteraceae bacterium]